MVNLSDLDLLVGFTLTHMASPHSIVLQLMRKDSQQWAPLMDKSKGFTSPLERNFSLLKDGGLDFEWYGS